MTKLGRRPADPKTPLGKWLLKYSVDNGLTRAQLADKTHVSAAHMSRTLMGAVNPSSRFARTVIRTLELNKAEEAVFRDAFERSRYSILVSIKAASSIQYDVIQSVRDNVHNLSHEDAEVILHILEKSRDG